MLFSKGSKLLSQHTTLAYGLLALALLLSGYIRYQFLNIPFERDEGEYCYIAQLLLEGKTPYLDFYEQKPPGLFYSYALLQAIFGNSLTGVHLAFILVNTLSILLIFGFCKQLFDTWAAAIASWSFALLSLSKMAAGFSAQAEHLIVLSFLAALFFLQKAFHQKRNFYWILSACFLSWCVLIKQSGLFFALAGFGFGLSYYFHLRPMPFKTFLKKQPLLLLGLLIPVVICLSVLYLQGAFTEMLFWVVEYPRMYIGQYDWASGLRRFLKNFYRISASYQSFWYLGGIALFALLFTKNIKLPKSWFYLLSILSFLAIIPGFRFYGHYFLLLFPGLAILIGLAFFLSQFYLSKKLYPVVPLSLVGIIFVLNIYHNQTYYFNHDSQQLLRTVYQTNPFWETKLISDYLKDHSQPEDQIAVWGSEPQINFYTDRKAASRHCFLLFLMGGNQRTAIWQKELIKETTEAKPRYIVKVNHPYSGNVNAKTLEIFYPWSIDYLAQHYQLIGLSEIYKDQASTLVWGKAALAQDLNSPYQLLIYQRK